MQRGNGNGIPAACAACKHQRKRCDNNCALAPYFPASKAREFQAVHKVYGMSNVIKILKSIEREEERRRAAESLVWEAFCRQRDPVLGSYGEFKKVAEELKVFKNQYQQLQEAYTRASELIGWNGINPAGGGGGGCRSNGGLSNYVNNSNNNNNNNNNNGGGSSRLESTTTCSYGGGYQTRVQIQEEEVVVHHGHGAERDVSTTLLHHVLPRQHSSSNPFTHQYCFPGELSSVNGRTVESVIWEGGS